MPVDGRQLATEFAARLVQSPEEAALDRQRISEAGQKLFASMGGDDVSATC